MRVKITRVVSGHRYMRTDFMDGYLQDKPSVGKSITAFGKSLDDDPEKTRVLTTSPVVKIEGNLYYTKNSTYRIEPIGECDND